MTFRTTTESCLFLLMENKLIALQSANHQTGERRNLFFIAHTLFFILIKSHAPSLSATSIIPLFIKANGKKILFLSFLLHISW